MSDTTFVNNSTVIDATWLNDVNDTVYHGLAGAQTPADVRTALGLGTAAQLDVGTTANKVVQLDGTAKLPAVDGSQLTGIVASVVDVTGATGTLPVAHGGTGATTPATARANLGSTTVGDAVFIAADAAAGRTALSAAGSGSVTSSGLTQATSKILGRTTAGTGAIEEISIGSGLSLSSGSLSATTASSVQIQPISASVAANALTISASALSLDFRSTTLGSGTVTTVSGTPSNLVISSGSTLGTVNATQSRIAVLAINNTGTIELAAVNISGGNQLDESNLISTTAEGGAGAADSANVIYSTTARTNVAYRVIGYIESTQATAGTWATAPSTIQGAGGNAVTSMQSFGNGQTWQNVLGSRVSGTTYYNTTGKTIFVCVGISTGSINSSVNGVSVSNGSQYGNYFPVPPGASYVVTATLGFWAELR